MFFVSYFSSDGIVGEGTASNSVPWSVRKFLACIDPVPFSFWNERPTLMSLERRAYDCSPLLLVVTCEANAGTRRTAMGLSEGAQPQTSPRFISIQAQ
jgi:hypothetical protein